MDLQKKKLAYFLCTLISVTADDGLSKDPPTEPKREIVANIKIPYERPIGFSLNLGSLASLTYEGRFILGLVPNLSLVVSPSFQKTIDIPFYDFIAQRYVGAFDLKRFNVGLGIRGHFYEYDSWDGFYIEGMSRAGLTWAGEDPSMWSIIPSLIFGYAAVYESGYTVSFGLGVEWKLLLGKPQGKNSKALKKTYFGISKLPITGELSLGWTW